MKQTLWVLVLLLLYACQDTTQHKETNKNFSLLSSEHTNIQFNNTVQNSKDFNIMNYRNFYNGGGVAVGDINNDGLEDIYFNGNMVPNKLYLNKGNFEFEDVTEKAGVAGKKAWSTGVVMVDINGDNWLDIYVCNAGYIQGSDQRNELFINNQDGTFTEKAAEYNLDENGFTTHAAFFDYDLDGDLDVYILNNSFLPVNTLNYSNKRNLPAEAWPVKDFVKGGGDKLLKNEGNTFVDVTKEAGIYTSLIGFGLGITVGDVNDDQYPDLYVSNDFFERDYLYINQKDGTFSEELPKWMNHISNFSMGADMADINNDGAPEIFVTDMLAADDYRLKANTQFEDYNVYLYKKKQGFHEQFMHNTLQLNNKNQSFSEIANFSGVSSSDWSWGALMFDADNDGLKDIYVCNGIGKDVINQDFIDFFANDVIQKMALSKKKEELDKVLEKMPSVPILNSFFHNKGNLKFQEANTDFGFNQPSFSNGAAYGDLDNDGDLDLVVNNLNQEAFIYKNQVNEITSNHYLGLELMGTSQNTKAIGAKIQVYSDSSIFMTEVIPSRGFQSSVSYKQIIGLGHNSKVDSVQIIWPDRQVSYIRNVPVDTVLKINRGEIAAMANVGLTDRKEMLFDSVSSPFEEIQEDAYYDFFNEGLIYKMLSQEGPAFVRADFNKDGLDDIFLGSATDQFSTLWLQTKDGRFTKKTNKVFETDNIQEQVTAAAADIDQDGDMDIVVGNGGNNIRLGASRLLNQIYLNDGKGNFSKGFQFSGKGYNTGCIVPMDLNNDGYPDLFVGERSQLGVFGLSPQSKIYINDGKGNFEDKTAEVAPEFSDLGMVTSATLANVMGDEKPELIVVGDWEYPQIYQQIEGKLKKVTSSLDGMTGWWRTVEAADLNGDGLTDLVLGNYGNNSYLLMDENPRLKLWVHDFDSNSDVEKIMSRTIKGKDKPVILKKELISQIPSLKRQNMMHEEYAKKSMQEIFGPILDKALVREALEFNSMVAYNLGDGNFSVQALPSAVQISCVNAIQVADVNNDQLPDLILGGNDFSFKPQYSRLDGSFGQVLINEKDHFRYIPNYQSGLMINGVVQHIAALSDNRFLFVKNNDRPVMYEIRK